MERLLAHFKPAYYNLELYIHSDEEYIQGTVKIDGELIGDTVKFHAVNMEISAVDFQASHWNGSDVTPTRKCQYDYDGNIIVIKLDAQMQKDLAKVHEINLSEDLDQRQLATFTIKYTAKLNHNMQGCYVSTYEFNGAPQKLIATQFESHYAREAFPCIDEPAAKASFELTLIVPDRKPIDVVLANTPLTTQDINRFAFEPTPPMSTYLLAWVVGPLKSVSTVNRGGVQVTSYAALNQSTTSLEFANEVAARALDYYDEKFGIKYPLPKLDQVALPDFEAGAMENWGLVTYREACMLAESDAAIDTKQSVAITVTHELSHQWFGNLVTMAWWDDLWLNESFATVMEYCATAALYPEFDAWQDFYTGDCVAALRRDCIPGVQAVQQTVHDPAEIATLFDGAIVYAKGARLVLMLMRAMGENNFYQGIHDYLETFKYRNAVGDDLWQHLQSHADFDIKSFMYAWISQPGYPVIQRKADQWLQQRFLIDGSTDDTSWPLPDIHDDMSGHYLIRLDDEEFQQKLAESAQLEPEAKLRLLIDRALLAKARIVPSSSLLDLLPQFTDGNAAVWDTLLGIINDLKIFFIDDSPEEDSYRQFLRTLIHDRVHQLGATSRLDDGSDTKRLRNILLSLARFSRDREIIDRLADQYTADLSHLDAELRGNILMAKVLRDEASVYRDLFDQYQTTTDPEIRDDLLGAIAAARNAQHIEANLRLLRQSNIVRPQDHLYLYIYLLRNPKSRAQALDWLYHNWEYIEQLTGDKSIEDYPRCTAGYIHTRAEADEFYHFFDQKSEQPVLKRAIAMAKSSIESRLTLVAEESAAVHAKLRALQSQFP